jgi:proprotein convertase subtilisin/kexin type 5
MCPTDFEMYCKLKLCEKGHCSYGGLCIKGKCLCLKGYGGVDCSIKCEGAIQNDQCVSSCT